jgi:hypothetical protein
VTPRVLGALLGALLALADLAGCGSDRRAADSSGYTPGSWYSDPAGSARSVHVEPKEQAGLPPRTFAELSAIYDARFEALGVRLSRASVIQLPAGPHLQLYVVPATAATNADYVTRIATLAKAVAPDAFSQWPALASLDVCQEPQPGAADSPARSDGDPPPVTVLFITRAQAAVVAWDNLTVTDLRRVIATTSGGELQVDPTIEADPAWTSTAPVPER